MNNVSPMRGRLIRTPALGSRSAGFSLIEVLIALVVLAFGLLGLALLQTMNLRYTQSANQRSQAIDLAGELLDIVRANRSEAAAYAAIQEGSFDGVDATSGCDAPESLSSANNITRWKCEVRERLGPDGSAKVTVAANKMTVEVKWTDEYWKEQADRAGGSGQITLETEL